MAVWLLLSGLISSVFASCSEYMDNQELIDYLNTTARLEPGLASLYPIGTTELRMDIPVLVLSAADPGDPVPNVKFIAGVHGDEAIGTQVLMSFIEHLIDGYKRGEGFVTWLLKNTRIHILPRLNLDVFDVAIEGVCSFGPGRNNSAGYDINRAFSPTSDFVPEASAVMAWLKHESDVYVLSASVMAGEMVVVYPPDDPEDYDGVKAKTDDDVFKHLASVYAGNHQSMSKGISCNGTKFMNGNGTVNGAEWYKVKGSMQDYNYKSGTMELTLEISCCKYPPRDQICTIWEENKLALLKLAAEACRGVRGRVTALGNPITGAAVSILGRNMTVRTNDEGYYFRILLPGKYFIKVEVSGMKTYINEFIVPESDTAFLKWKELNVELEAESQSPASTINENTNEENQTISYDQGGLDPYTSTTTTYDDSYFSSQNDSHIRVGLVKGAANHNRNNICFISLALLCKYLTVYVLTG